MFGCACGKAAWHTGPFRQPFLHRTARLKHHGIDEIGQARRCRYISLNCEWDRILYDRPERSATSRIVHRAASFEPGSFSN